MNKQSQSKLCCNTSLPRQPSVSTGRVVIAWDLAVESINGLSDKGLEMCTAYYGYSTALLFRVLRPVRLRNYGSRDFTGSTTVFQESSWVAACITAEKNVELFSNWLKNNIYMKRHLDLRLRIWYGHVKDACSRPSWLHDNTSTKFGAWKRRRSLENREDMYGRRPRILKCKILQKVHIDGFRSDCSFPS